MTADPKSPGSPVWVRLTGRGGIDITGSERLRWLDGMVTQDVASLRVGGFAPTFILTHQGRIVSEAFVWVFEDRIRLDLERAAVEPVIAHLDRFIIADDVELADASEGATRFAIEGAGARHAIAREPIPGDAIATIELGGVGVVAVPHALVEAEGVQLLAPAGGAETVAAALVERGIAEASTDALEVRRVERGVPRYGREIDASVLPAETRLERAISSSKGCYAGQEVVARMRSRGQVASLLVALRFEGEEPVAAGERILRDGKKIGEVTSVVRSESLGAIGLGYVKTAHAEAGTEVAIAGSTARLALPACAAEWSAPEPPAKGAAPSVG